MMIRIFPAIFCVAFLFSGCGNTQADGAPNKGKPNIVFIFADDQTFESIAALGNAQIKTPNLDRLVRGGTTFTHAYNMGGWDGAICVASRSMLLSGRYLWRAQKEAQGWADKDSAALNRTWPKLMEQAGYNTYMTGKWHVKAPVGSVFQQANHVRPGMPSYARSKKGGGKKKAGYNRPLSPEDHSWSPTDSAFGGYWSGGKHWSEVVKDDAITYLEDATKKNQPFFMYLAFNAPHDPRQSPQEYLDMYPLDSIPVPENFLPEYPYKDQMGAGQGLRDEALAPFPRTEYAVRKHRQEYYALISHLDAQIGHILDALEASGQMDNTYVIFTADHGLSVGHHGLMGKQNMYDHSMRVPFMITGPGIPQGERRDQSIYLQDAMATALELAGIAKPDHVEFESVMGLIRQPEMKGHLQSVYGAYTSSQRMLVQGDYKLIVYPKAVTLRLFNLKADPLEINDLARQPAYRKQGETLMKELRKQQEKMGDPMKM